MLVTLKDMLTTATKDGYGVIITRANFSDEVRAAICIAEEKKPPIALEIRPAPISILNRREYAAWVRFCCEKASVPVAMSVETPGTPEAIQEAIEMGATSVFISEGPGHRPLSAGELAAFTDTLHAAGLSCSARLGNKGSPAAPEEAAAILEKTGLDCLALELVQRGQSGPHVDLDRLAKTRAAVGGSYPLILHGGFGLSIAQYGEACKHSISALNIAKDIWAAVRARVHEDQKDPYCSVVKATEESLAELFAAAGCENRA